VTLELRRSDHLAALRQPIIDVYTDARANLLHLPNYRVSAFTERLDRHGTELGWEAVVAFDDDKPVGYAYINTVPDGNRWWQRMNPPVPAHYTAQPALALKEIAVSLPWRGTGTARRIHDTLLSPRPEPYVTLLVNPLAGNGKVQAVYESWGYQQISTQQPSPESPLLHAMIRRTHPDQDEH
jgi:hypothetical protein